MPPQNEASDLLDTDISFSLERLFDPYNMDHIPVEKHLDGFNQRDLYHVRHYKAAVKIFGGPLSRKRVIIAPPMETPWKHRLGLYQGLKTFPSPPVVNTQLKPQTPPTKGPSKEMIAAMKEQKKIEEYQSWMSQRMKLRANLENMGLNEKWLQRKGDMSEVEARVMNRLRAERLKEPEEEPRRVLPRPAPPEPCVPKLSTPSPEALHGVKQFLQEQRLRLVDLFQQVDKDKNWSLSKAEFLNAISTANLPIKKEKLEDLMWALDMNLNDEVEYKELKKGLGILKLEHRALKREEMSASGANSPVSRSSSASSRKWSSMQHSSSGNEVQSLNLSGDLEQETRIDAMSSQSDGKRSASSGKRSTSSGKRSASSGKRSTSSGKSSVRSGSSSSQYLEPPELDLRQEQFILDSEEKMVDRCKCTLGLLKLKASSGGQQLEMPSAIKVGYKPIDDHLLKSTLDSDKRDMIELFRHRTLKEYDDIIKLCKEHNVVLTKKLLDRVLLYPPERPYHEMFDQIGRCWRSRNKVFKTQMADTQKEKKSRRVGIKQVDSNLDSSDVSSKVDCWISFDEYCKLTGYKPRHIDSNAFWPGHLLDKLRLCMPPYDGAAPSTDNRHAIFHEVKKTKRCNHGYDNNMKWWPPGRNGYVQYADCETYHRRLLD
ncbi:EF-hand calcium-binding domain-containing protein 12-like [Gigantopelta aegis]|uniref:EF-hand calcium-binding domain-containing protein 12-like n=1 Tax=Gigantopelta aegis TaxID=1735272 RepID=UPI001B88A86C|nr:EF-hand calcium-binding domain-containing protein 12-like [Gigantopelta aegis]XP_041347498.1 EF-hand calcium-binding domain-containing protein 12-like [Gigantopelta aegis]